MTEFQEKNSSEKQEKQPTSTIPSYSSVSVEMGGATDSR